RRSLRAAELARVRGLRCLLGADSRRRTRTVRRGKAKILMRRAGVRPSSSRALAQPLLKLAPALVPIAFVAFPCQPALARNRWTGPCVAGQKRPICHFWKAKIVTKSG